MYCTKGLQYCFAFLKILQNSKNFTTHTAIYIDLYEYVVAYYSACIHVNNYA